jgi:hypothetical protein
METSVSSTSTSTSTASAEPDLLGLDFSKMLSQNLTLDQIKEKLAPFGAPIEPAFLNISILSNSIPKSKIQIAKLLI